MSVSIYYGTQSDIRVKSYFRLNLIRASVFNLEHLSINYDTLSGIRVKSYCRLNFLRVSVFNLERLDILRDSTGHPCIKLLSFHFAQSFYSQFRATRYITRLNWTSEYKVIFVWICSELLFSISCVSNYYGTQSDIQVKSYCRFNLLRASSLNFERVDILPDSIGHPSKKLLSFDFSHSFSFQFRASRYTTGQNRTSESKVIIVWICSKPLFSITSVSIYYGSQSDIRVKSYCRLIFLRASVFNFERLDILRHTIGHPSQKLLSFEFAQSFCFQLRACRYITGLNRTSE